ncbi:hypothetical protein Sjap_013551 [Stephania japonica]|uniref:Uncharacterized protein n=1 Tax=Stephania japonica TaxID=461633 RepID=A0AAP0IY38_9MAGN
MEVGMSSSYCDVGVEGEEDGCRTPSREECMIAVNLRCPPPPPRKKPGCSEGRGAPPKNGYFQHPDLEVLLSNSGATL